MPVLSIRVVKTPRQERRCEECGLWIEGEQIRIYGMAELYEKPFLVFLHRKCATGKEVTPYLDAHPPQPTSLPKEKLNAE